jgi:hypothetical protein
MANLCSNIVTFKGSSETLKQIENLFRSLAAKEALTEFGQLPDFIPSTFPYFYNIRWEDEQLYYTTKWSPNMDSVVEVSKHFGVEHTHFYCEPGCLLYGEAIYANGELKNILLNSSDFKSYEHDEENDRYIFEGKEYEDVYEIWEILLERKKNNK